MTDLSQMSTEDLMAAAGAVPTPKAPVAAPDLSGYSNEDLMRAANPAPKEPLAGMPSLWPSFVNGARQPLDAAAQLLGRGVEAVAPVFGQGAADWATQQRQNTEAVNKDAADQYAGTKVNDPVPGRGAAEFVGNVAATAPVAYAMPGSAATKFLPRVLSGAASGGVTNALQPVDASNGDFWGKKRDQVALGALTGAGTSAFLAGASKLVQPSAQVQTLLDAGVPLTPGQSVGGAFNRMEQGATSIPLVGDQIRNAQFAATKGFNRGAINQVLAPIGETLGESTPLGREAIQEMADKVGANYDKLVPQLTVKVDAPFQQGLSDLTGLAQFLPTDARGQFNKFLTDKVLKQFSPNGTMTGETFKEIESAIGSEARGYVNSAVGSERKLGSAFLELQGQLRDLLMRSNPEQAGALQAANTAYSNMLRVQGAAAASGSKEGVFTPAQLLASVRQLDPSLRKSSFARGNAVMQDLAEAGKSVMGTTVPDSGTAYRAWPVVGALGGIGTVSPMSAAGLGAAGAGAMAAYTPWGTALGRGLLANGPLASGLRAMAPAASLTAGLLSPGR